MREIKLNRCRLERMVRDSFGRESYLPMAGTIRRDLACIDARRYVEWGDTIRVYDEIERKVVWAGSPEGLNRC